MSVRVICPVKGELGQERWKRRRDSEEWDSEKTKENRMRKQEIMTKKLKKDGISGITGGKTGMCRHLRRIRQNEQLCKECAGKKRQKRGK
nr:hypothetical protein MACL_00002907 [Theileria orientalis]